MAVIRPFAALRPSEKYAEKVISLPYDVMNRSEALKLSQGNPLSFLHISRSEIDLPHIENPHHPEVYRQSKQKLDEFVFRGILVREEQPCLYIYRQTMNGRSQTGIAGCVSIDEYLDGTIRRHELTLVEKEQDRIHHFDACSANTEPVFLTYRHSAEIHDFTEDWIQNHAPVYDLIDVHSVGHTLWVVDDPKKIEGMAECFHRIPTLYIADGHHRSASAVKVGMKRREEKPHYDGSEEFNYFMAVIFPDSDLKLYDYNRVVKDLNGMSKEEFLTALSSSFRIEKMSEAPFDPDEPHVFSMFLERSWYRLSAKDSILSSHIIQGLDVSILQNHVLEPLLGIRDPRTDSRIEFVGGIHGMEELERRTETDMAVAFALYPVSMEDMLTASDQNETMPPKSTWFEPKLGSGLFIHML